MDSIFPKHSHINPWIKLNTHVKSKSKVLICWFTGTECGIEYLYNIIYSTYYTTNNWSIIQFNISGEINIYES